MPRSSPADRVLDAGNRADRRRDDVVPQLASAADEPSRCRAGQRDVDPATVWSGLTSMSIGPCIWPRGERLPRSSAMAFWTAASALSALTAMLPAMAPPGNEAWMRSSVSTVGDLRKCVEARLRRVQRQAGQRQGDEQPRRDDGGDRPGGEATR